MSWPQVLLPDTVDELLALRAEHGPDATPIAGGTALMIRLRSGVSRPGLLLSLNRLTELGDIDVTGGKVRIGSLVTHRRLERSAALRGALPLLSSTVALIANRRVRNVGTIGGNISDADYGYDPPGVVCALDGSVTLRSLRGARTLPLAEFAIGYRRTTLADDEILTSVELPVPGPDTDWVYLKHLTRSVEDRPAMSVCALADRAADGRCRELRVMVRAARPTPLRVSEAEAMARGRRLSEPGLAAEIADAYAAAADPVEDHRASAAYRRRLVPVLVRRALADLDRRARRAVKV